jgi:hypothetical protein
MKALLAFALSATLLGGCSKSSDSGTTSDASSPAADATTSGAGPASDASPASDVAGSAAGSASPTDGASPAGAAAENGGNAIELPVYPGATEERDKGLSMSTGKASVKMQFFKTKADSKTVVDWYKSHLPSSWQNFVLSNNGKTVGTFASESANGSKPAGADQSVIVTSDSGVTRIQLTTKKSS